MLGLDPVNMATDQFGPFGVSRSSKSVLDGLDLKRVFFIFYFPLKHPFESWLSKTLLEGPDAPNGPNWVLNMALVQNGIQTLMSSATSPASVELIGHTPSTMPDSLIHNFSK